MRPTKKKCLKLHTKGVKVLNPIFAYFITQFLNVLSTDLAKTIGEKKVSG